MGEIAHVRLLSPAIFMRHDPASVNLVVLISPLEIRMTLGDYVPA
ncbi:MAG: hypothetical protein ABSD88_09800 [Candidatus Korobacteraceae bacterium]